MVSLYNYIENNNLKSRYNGTLIGKENNLF